MNMIAISLVHLALALTGVTAVWLVQLRTRNAGVIDAAWPLLIGLGAGLYALLGPGNVVMRSVLAVLGIAWALRLGVFLALRNVGHAEDRRYAELRRKWGLRTNVRMLQFFWLQAVIAWMLGLSFVPVASHAALPAGGWWLAGAALGLVGIVGEGLADAQLQRFRRDPANHGHVCDHGLWRYSRHPNYFFECLHWTGYPLLAIGAPHAALALIGPLLIALLLFKLSGIPTVESAEASRRRKGYDDYVRRTSVFFPLPPRRVP